MKKKIAIFLLLGQLFAFPLFATQYPGENDPFFQNVWKKFNNICNDAVALVTDDHRNSRTVLEVLTLREPKYARLLGEARDALAQSAADMQFGQIDRLRQKNHELEREIVDLKRARISAPESSYNPLVDTRKSIDKKLAKIPGQIDANETAIAALKREILDILARRGMELDEGELDYFLISAEGGELMRLMAIAENMKRIQGAIERELRNDPNNVELAKTYAGMYLVSLDAYLNAHGAAIKNIAGYREKLGLIAKEARANRDEAIRLRRGSANTDLVNIDANIRLNDKTLDAAGMYDSLLRRRTSNLEESRKSVNRKVEIARNTYKTLVNGGSLIALVDAGANDYSLLINFEMPELKNIYDSGMLAAFTDISEKIKAEK